MRATNSKAALQKFHVTSSRGGSPSLVHVMDDESDICYHVPALAAQVPATLQCAVKLRLCRNMATTGICDFGTKCMFVHVHPDVLKHCERSQVHTNFAWKSLEEVPYTRHEAGSVFHVLKPKDSRPGDTTTVVPSERVLVTRGSLDYEARATMMFNLSQNSSSPVDTKIQPTALCAHYYINRSCRLGSSCHFIHLANVDQAALPGKKAKKRASLPSCCEYLDPHALSRRSSDSRDFLSDSPHSDDLTASYDNLMMSSSLTSTPQAQSLTSYPSQGASMTNYPLQSPQSSSMTNYPLQSPQSSSMTNYALQAQGLAMPCFPPTQGSSMTNYSLQSPQSSSMPNFPTTASRPTRSRSGSTASMSGYYVHNPYSSMQEVGMAPY